MVHAVDGMGNIYPRMAMLHACIRDVYITQCRSDSHQQHSTLSGCTEYSHLNILCELITTRQGAQSIKQVVEEPQPQAKHSLTHSPSYPAHKHCMLRKLTYKFGRPVLLYHSTSSSSPRRLSSSEPMQGPS